MKVIVNLGKVKKQAGNSKRPYSLSLIEGNLYLAKVKCMPGPKMAGWLKGFMIEWAESTQVRRISKREKEALVEYLYLVEICNNVIDTKRDYNRNKKNLKIAVLEKYGNTCFYCSVGAFEQIDHKTPICRGGGNSLDNLVPSCRSCNAKKHDLTVEEFLKSGRI